MTGELTIKPEGLPSGIDISKNDSETIQKLKIESITKIYSYVIIFLGVIVLLDVLVIGSLLFKGATIPDGLIAIGSAAVGAIAGILAQPPASGK